MTNTNSNDYWAIAEDAPLGTTTQCHEAACHQYVGDITAHQAQVHKRTVRDRNLSLLNSKGRGIAGRVLPVLTAGALSLGAIGCTSSTDFNKPVVVTGIEEDAYIVKRLDNSQEYRAPFIVNHITSFEKARKAQIGDTIMDLSFLYDPRLYAAFNDEAKQNYVTEGKIKLMKGGQ